MGKQNQMKLDIQEHLEGICVLLVEDEPDIAELFSLVLESVGANLIKATSALEALQALDQCTLDVLVCNLNLPDLTGYQLLQQIRQQEANSSFRFPAIAVTSYRRDFIPEHAFQAGFDQFIEKPIEPEFIVRAILHLVNSRT